MCIFFSKFLEICACYKFLKNRIKIIESFHVSVNLINRKCKNFKGGFDSFPCIKFLFIHAYV